MLFWREKLILCSINLRKDRPFKKGISQDLQGLSTALTDTAEGHMKIALEKGISRNPNPAILINLAKTAGKGLAQKRNTSSTVGKENSIKDLLTKELKLNQRNI